jgi:hypothetical protein
VEIKAPRAVGFTHAPENVEQLSLSYAVLIAVYETTPGLVADKLKAVLEFAWSNRENRAATE